MKVTVLYSELAEYTVSSLNQLKNCGVEIELFHWPINAEAPFQFDLSFAYEAMSRNSLSDAAILKKVKTYDPDLILCSGWMDKGYVEVCNQFRGQIPIVLSMDNHWNGSLKQRFATLIAPFSLRKTFSHAFVPGRVQEEYARKLGFPEERIKLGFYSADTSKFDQIFRDTIADKSDRFPKRFLYLGRYVEHKGIFELWHAFQKVRERNSEWELWCVGTGDQFENRIESEGIKHFGFVQPSDLEPILKETGVYILPSHFEPWGVSVQEMAISGMPLILSSAIGSKEAFLNEGVNGYEFRAEDEQELQNAMGSFVGKTDEELLAMGRKSHELGMSNSPKKWANTLISILDSRSE